VLLSGRAAPRAVQDSLSRTALKFSAANKLSRAVGFEHVLHAECISDRYFKVFFVRNSEKFARLGIIASKRSLSAATDRNRVKRIIRESFRHHNIKNRNLDLVVMTKNDYSWMVNARIDNLEKLFSQVENRCAE
jgi:ribonuclease P protein component